MEAVAENINYTFEDTSLSPNMQDYVEMIEILSRKMKVVRVKDIAKNLNIKMPSVTAALQKLEEMGLINYERYGYIELTDKGKKIGENVYNRHTCLSEFFSAVLKMENRRADEVACRVEHQLTSEACKQIYKFIEFFKSEKEKSEQWTERLNNILEERTLAELREGDTGKIVRISGSSPLKKRLGEMGFRKGEVLKVVKYAPLKDPLEIKIKDYNISLRMEEAKAIIIKPVIK
jgi:DtxR family transcriptional regulator, Mn-dependent transcriptional regulator